MHIQYLITIISHFYTIYLSRIIRYYYTSRDISVLFKIKCIVVIITKITISNNALRYQYF